MMLQISTSDVVELISLSRVSRYRNSISSSLSTLLDSMLQ